MAEITTRRQGQMIQALFRILEAEPDGLQAKDAISRVGSVLELTEFELSTFPKNPDLVRFPKILRFSTINSVKAGWMLKKSGIWTLTDEGRVALQKFADPEALFRESRRLYKQWKASQPDDEKESNEQLAETEQGDDDDQGLIAAATLEESEEAARQAILEYLAAMNPYSFQDLVGSCLRPWGITSSGSRPREKMEDST